jgi:hypothetical protein
LPKGAQRPDVLLCGFFFSPFHALSRPFQRKTPAHGRPLGTLFFFLPTYAHLPKPLDRVRKTFFRTVSFAMEAGILPNSITTPSAVNDTTESNPVVSKKQAAAEQKARRDAHLLRLIDGTTWQNLDNYIVEDNVLKQMIGFDASLFSVDMLRKICGKLGYVSRKYTKAVCLETILKAHKDLQAYDGIEPNSSGNNDSTSIRCRLLNVLFSDACLSRFQMLGSKKTMAELDKGGAGQDKEFWEFVAVQFNDYENNQYGSLLVTSAYDKKLFFEKNVNPSVNVGSNKTWESLRKIYLLIQKDYRKKFERFKTSGNHESNFHDFCHGRLDTYYLHVCLQQRDANTLEVVIEDLPEEVQFESGVKPDVHNNSTISSNPSSRRSKRKSPAEVLEQHLKEKSRSSTEQNILATQKAVRVQLKSYCMGMKQLMSLNKYKESSANDVEQHQLLERMKSTIGVAVGNMEEAIKAGTIWCPLSQENVVANTPKKSNKMPRRSSSSSSNVVQTKRTILMSSSEKELSNCSDSDNEDYDTCLSEQKTFCCAGDYCWKEDLPKNFTVTCSLCGGKCHEHCTTKNQDTGAMNCDRCVRES